MSGDIQPRKRKGKGKKKDEMDDDVTDIKSKGMANHSSKSHSTSNSDSSGVVAKIIFLILLISLSVVIGLILVELRVGMKETVSVISEAEDARKEEEFPAPEIPSSSIDMDEEIIPEAPSPVLQHEMEEEYEPIEATPPLEEYVQVVEEVIVEVPPPEQRQVVEEVVVPAEVAVEEDAVLNAVSTEEVETTDEVVKVDETTDEVVKVDKTTDEEVVKVDEFSQESPSTDFAEAISVEDAKDESEPIEGAVEEAAPVEVVEIVEVIEEITPVEEVVEIVEVVEEVAPVEQVTPEAQEITPVEEAAQAEEKVEEIKSDAPLVVETAVPTMEGVNEDILPERVVEDGTLREEVVQKTASVEVVEEPEVSKVVEGLDASVEVQEDEPSPLTVESTKETDDNIEVEEHETDDDKEEGGAGAKLSQEETEEQEEDWSQYGKEGGAGALTDAYLRVEALAEEVLMKDPDNAMVAQLAPHLSGVLRAMESGQTEGLLDTLSHIQVLLEDVKGRVEEKEGPNEHLKDAIQDSKTPFHEKADITSEIDNGLREELDAAEKLIPRNPREALNTFGAILHHNPKSARALYGRARSLDQLAEVERSNSKLEQAIVIYRGLLDLADEDPNLVPLPLLRMSAERCIDRMIFRGFLGKAVRVQQRLLQWFPDDVLLRNKMGVTFLLMNQGSAAKEIFETVLQKWPDNGFAQVHYGYILKTTYNNNTGGAVYMQKGIESGAEGTEDGRFYFHLGDALQREGKTKEAYEVYDLAVKKGLFLNRYQRSLYNVDRLTSKPCWTPEETTYQMFFRNLEKNWRTIRDEGVALLALPPQDGFRPEAENLQDTGDWKQYELFSRGRKITANCVKASKTCSLIENFPPAAGCKRGQVKFSVMHPDTHVHAHTGPTNCRLRAHLGLVVPSGLRLRIGNEMTTWQEGKILIFDDSWEHEVWHEGDSYRLVLIVDVWHPELSDHERKTLSTI
ncbi:aspartyl/asparaginyl beta-hydroxylase-like isoform X2 [Panulirus ornatus]|uniref:aspartyl/asparaginyl beta-hydroxylase-like isoform X2 n=1 Tax=Panulirus ornatus TaxID=150431 RepID=UPI003A836467